MLQGWRFLILWVAATLAVTFHDQWHLYSFVRRNVSVAHNNCLYISDTWYCQKSSDMISECAGHRWSFMRLREANVSAEQLLEWLIPVAIVDAYVQMTSTDNESFICNCSRGWFGPSCTFSLPNVSPAQHLLTQLLDTTTIFQSPICYTDMLKQCISGLYCLDWRSVCDGIWQCDGGEDEADCARLEANSCETDEFRCRNGACIPAEFVFDGQYDCQDLSDEHHLYSFTNCYKRLDLDCDERLCNSDEPFSCGDGQCLAWQQLLDSTQSCTTFRDVFHRCELHRTIPLHTGADGICTTLIVDAVFDEADLCENAIRRMMSASGVRDLWNFERECPSIIIYPKVAWLTKSVFTAYDKSWLRTLITNKTYFFQIDKNQRMPHLLCDYNTITCRNVSELLHKPGTIFSFDKFPEPSTIPSNFYRCANSTRLVHIHRLNDGHTDCIFGDDEFRDDIFPTEPHRFRCVSPSPTQYVRTQQLGDGVRDCKDGSDELSPTVNWPWFRCTRDDNYACALLRSAESIAQAKIQFHRICDSFWDTAKGLNDERNCSLWRCPTNLVVCNGTGQCIKDKWRCDGEFDCSDGEDERGPYCPKRPFALAELCDHVHEHVCVTDAHARDPNRFPPCVSYDRVGDDHVDCLGGHDERNTIACPHDGDMLGKRFLCPNGTCVESWTVCNGVNDCEEGDDERVCTWNYRNRSNNASSSSPCSTFRCANGICLSSHPCISKSTCTKAEHHIWCPSPETFPRTKGTSPTYRTFCEADPMSVTKSLSTTTADTTAISVTTPQPLIRSEMYAAPTSSKSKRFCRRGLFVSPDACFCPPPYYGPRCEFSSNRIPLRVTLDRLNARKDLSAVLHVYALLMCNSTHIVDVTHFIDLAGNVSKHDAYLLYGRRLSNGCQYSVHFEAYDDKLVLAGLWSFHMAFDFLPSYRIAKVLRFMSAPKCLSTNMCENNGTCHVANNNRTFSVCVCSTNYTGSRCEIFSTNRCSSTALQRGPICICAPGYLPPHCHIRNQVCEEQPDACANNGTCYPYPILGKFLCICAHGFHGARCQKQLSSLVVTSNRTHKTPVLVQIFAVRFGYTLLLKQSIAHAIPARVDFDDNDAFTQIALAHTFISRDEYLDRQLFLLDTNCSNVAAYRSVQLDAAMLCVNQQEWGLDSRQFHAFCAAAGKPNLCFYDGSYLCRCLGKRSECITYHNDAGVCTQKHVCLNGGICVQSDTRNDHDVTCVCPMCTSGTLCQFAFGRFAFSFETLIFSAEQSYLSYQIIIPLLMFIVGLVLNGISIDTFVRLQKNASSGCAIYLLVNSIAGQLVLGLLLARIIYLMSARRYILHSTLNLRMCRLLPYFMSACWYTCLWLQTCVTCERLLAVMRPTTWRFAKTPRCAILVTIVLMGLLFGSTFPHMNTYRIMQHPSEQIMWCVAESTHKLIRYVLLVHQLIPFLIHTVLTTTLLVRIGYAKAAALGDSKIAMLKKTIRKYIELIVAPCVCFLTQSPQIVILFLNSCAYARMHWFAHITLIAVYISFTPQMLLFFIYILPSPSYKRKFMSTHLGQLLFRSK